MVQYVGKSIWARRDQLKVNSDKEYCWADLTDRKVIDSKGKCIGKVTKVHNYGASDVVFVKSEDGKSLEIPFVKSYFNMDFEGKEDELHLVVDSSIFDECWA